MKRMFKSSSAFLRSQFNDDPEDGELLRAKYLSIYSEMPLEEKRKLYKCGGSFVTLDEIQLWPALYGSNSSRIAEMLHNNLNRKKESKHFAVNANINDKISVWMGDITKVEIDAIVNAANRSLRGGGGVDGAIHRAAGYDLLEECITLNGCNKGESKITCGHKLPAKFVIHTVGPRGGESPLILESCYKTCLQLALKHNIRSIAFSGISTGAYAFPNRQAANIALRTVREWLEEHLERVDRIIFCTYAFEVYEEYQELMAGVYFPCDPKLLMTVGSTDSKVGSNFSLQSRELFLHKSGLQAETAVTSPAKLPAESLWGYDESSSKESERADYSPNVPSESVDISPAKLPVESDCVYDETNVTKPRNSVSIDACTVINEETFLAEVKSVSDD